MDDPVPQATSARREVAERDIEAVLRQLADDELDAATAERLINGYRSEIDLLDRKESGAEEIPGEADGASRSRRLVGALVMAGILVGVSVTAYQAIRPREGGFITGEVGTPVDLSEVTNEQMEAVIAANPDIPEIAAMRLSLADRYFEEGRFSEALPHYLGALEGALDRTRRARALSRVGWMSYLSGDPEVAVSYLAEALEIDPDYAEGHLFLGLLLFRRGDAPGALAHLEPLLAQEGLPDSTRQAIEQTVAAARTLIEADG